MTSTTTTTTTTTSTVSSSSSSSSTGSDGSSPGAGTVKNTNVFAVVKEETNSFQQIAGLYDAVCEDSNDATTTTVTRRDVLRLFKFGAYGVDTVVCPSDGVVLRMSHSALYVARSLVGSRFLKHPGFFCVMTTTRNKSSAVSLLKKGKCSAVDRLENMSIKLGEAAHQVLVTPNAGGDSVVSECLSVEVLSRLLFSNDTTLIATEMDIRYFPSGGSMTDYLIKWGTANVSVSVTRVFDGADLDGASRILEKKLRGVAFARKSLFAPVQGSECSWILHIFVPNGKVAKLVKKAWGKLDESVRGGVVVVVTIWKETALYDRTR